MASSLASFESVYSLPIRSMPQTSPRAAADSLRDALTKLAPSAFTGDGRELRQLELNVYDFVDELKAAGIAPEHVIRSLKGIVLDAKIGPSSLLDRMVTWSVERYFNT